MYVYVFNKNLFLLSQQTKLLLESSSSWKYVFVYMYVHVLLDLLLWFGLHYHTDMYMGWTCMYMYTMYMYTVHVHVVDTINLACIDCV